MHNLVYGHFCAYSNLYLLNIRPTQMEVMRIFLNQCKLFVSDNRSCYPISWASGSWLKKLKLCHSRKRNYVSNYLIFCFRNQLSSTIDLHVCDFLLTANHADHLQTINWFKLQEIIKPCYLKTMIARALLYILPSNS